MSDVTRILQSIEEGDTQAAKDLLPLVYDELRKLASVLMAQETSSHTLQPTALVHEAYLRLVGTQETPNWANVGHFFAAAAEAMRRVLINHARDKRRLKRGGGNQRVDLSTIGLGANAPVEDVVEFNDALEKLEQREPQSAALVKLRCFAGLTQGEAATTLGIPRRTADRYWAFARAWIYKELHPDSD
jgi:RNA polymerase sigma factor (TIGR02999 family)